VQHIPFGGRLYRIYHSAPLNLLASSKIVGDGDKDNSNNSGHRAPGRTRETTACESIQMPHAKGIVIHAMLTLKAFSSRAISCTSKSGWKPSLNRQDMFKFLDTYLH
jgi:hypothetical protein